MIRVRAKIRAGFGMSRHTVAHVCARSPIQPYKKSSSLIQTDEKTEFSSKNSTEMSFGDGAQPESECGNNRVMVVVDQSPEAKGALNWALSHAVQSRDTVILLHITKPSKQGGNTNDGVLDQRHYELLSSMQNICQTRRPGVQVVLLQEGKETGPVIVEAAKQQKVSLLVLGQRKRTMMWRMHTIWSGKRMHPKIVKYCIQNANCMTIAVRRKNRKSGGYLITSKRHKDFWLLA